MEQNHSGITDEFIEIVLPTPPAPEKKKRPRWPWFVCSALFLVGLTAGILAFLFSSQGQASPTAVAEQYMAAFAADRSGAVYRLFPSVIQSRHSGSRADLVIALDDFAAAYGQEGEWTLTSSEDYDQSSRLHFSTILNVDITGYQHLTVQKILDAQTRNLHLDVIEIDGKWYLAQVWNDDILPHNGADQPEDAVDTYISAFAANDAEGMALGLSPALLDRAIKEGYGLRDMLCEIDDFYADGLSGNPISYTLTQTKDYSAYQAQSMAEVLGVQPQVYRAYYYEAIIDETVYNLVIDLVQVDGRWGITAVWDYNKNYIL